MTLNSSPLSLSHSDRGRLHRSGFYATAAARVLRLDVIGEIGEQGGKGITCSAFKRAIDNAPSSVNHIELTIHSDGGDALECLAITNLLVSSGLTVSARVIGVAASAASVIACAASSVEMYDGSLMYVHCAWSAVSGFADDFYAMAATLDKISGAMEEVYMRKSGQPRSKITELMANDGSWLGAEDCLSIGLADSIAKGTEEELEIEEQAFALARSDFRLLAFYAAVPRRLTGRGA